MTIEGMAIFIIPTVSPMRTSTPIGHHGFVGREDVQQLRLGFHGFDGEIDLGNALPGLPQVVQNDAEEAVQQLLFDLGDIALNAAPKSFPMPPSSISRMGKTSEGFSSSTPLPS